MVEKFVGKFLLESSENFDEYMKKVGVSLITRKLASAAKNTVTFTVDGPNITYNSESSVRSQTFTFQLGVEFDETTPDGRKVKSTVTLSPDGSKMIHEQRSVEPNGKSTTVTRWIQGEYLMAEIVCEGVKCLRKYKKID